jgi:hypothetical protein
MKPSCVYCLNENAETRDHIPPKCFFPKNVSTNINRITVPCCEPCRKQQKDDEFVRNVLTSVEAVEDHPAIASDISERRNRSFWNAPPKGLKLLEIIKKVEVVTPGGIYLGDRYAFTLRDSRMDKFMERAARAVMFDAYGETYFAARFEWVLNPDIPVTFPSAAPETSKRKQVADIFSYVVTPRVETKTSWVIMVFYQRVQILAKLDPPINSSRR